MTTPSSPGGHFQRIVLHVFTGAAEDRVAAAFSSGVNSLFAFSAPTFAD